MFEQDDTDSSSGIRTRSHAQQPNRYTTKRNRPGVLVEATFVSSLIETALLLILWCVHGVLKWLHHPVLRYVMLWHSTEFSHDFLHCSMSVTLTGEFSMYSSPALVSHSILEPTSSHVPRFLGAPVTPSNQRLSQLLPCLLNVICYLRTFCCRPSR